MLVGGCALVPAAGDERGHAVQQQCGPALAQKGMRQPGSVGVIRAQFGQCVIPLAEPVPQHRRGDPGRAIGVPAALGSLAGAPQRHLGLWPAVQVLQGEDAAVLRERAQVRVARVVAQHAQRPVDVVKRGHVIAPDGTGQPQIGQGVRCRERVACLLAGGQRLDRGRVGRVQVTGRGPLQHRQQGQHPGPPLRGQSGRRQGLPHGRDRVITAARADLCAGQHPVGLGPPHRVGHHRQRPAGLPGRLLVGPGGEQGPGQAGHEPVPGFVASGHRVQLAAEYLGSDLRGLGGQRGPGLEKPFPDPGLTRLVRGGQLLCDAQHARAGGR